MICAPRSAAATLAMAPLNLPTALRSAAVITTSSIPTPKAHALMFEVRRQVFDGGPDLCPSFIHVGFEFRPSGLVGALQLAEVLPRLHLRGAQRFEHFLILQLGVGLDLFGTGFEGFGLRLPFIQLLFHQGLIIFPNSHGPDSCYGLIAHSWPLRRGGHSPPFSAFYPLLIPQPILVRYRTACIRWKQPRIVHGFLAENAYAASMVEKGSGLGRTGAACATGSQSIY